MEVLSLLWSLIAFALSLVWQLAWFVLRDLISTLLWILIIAWLILSVRYRSFSAGTMAMVRYGSYSLRLFWHWLRGIPGQIPAPRQRDKVRVRYRKPLGTMSLSEQLNMLLVAAIYLLLLS